jgi:hypothetical protein
VSGTLVEVLEKKFKLDHSRPRIFSLSGSGFYLVLETVQSSGGAIVVPDFSATLPSGEIGQVIFDRKRRPVSRVTRMELQ